MLKPALLLEFLSKNSKCWSFLMHGEKLFLAFEISFIFFSGVFKTFQNPPNYSGFCNFILRDRILEAFGNFCFSNEIYSTVESIWQWWISLSTFLRSISLLNDEFYQSILSIHVWLEWRISIKAIFPCVSSVCYCIWYFILQ